MHYPSFRVFFRKVQEALHNSTLDDSA